MTAFDTVFPRQKEADELAFRLQRGFRALLGAMARPGELCDLDAPSPEVSAEGVRAHLLPQTIMVCDVLLDSQTSVAVAGMGGCASARALSRRTHVHVRAFEEARFGIVPLSSDDNLGAEAVMALSPGTLVSPQLGATCIVECATLIGQDGTGARAGSSSGGDKPASFELTGPGIETTARIALDRVPVMKALVARKDEFPCGVDVVLVDGAGHICCIPRSTHVEAQGAFEEVDAWAM